MSTSAFPPASLYVKDTVEDGTGGGTLDTPLGAPITSAPPLGRPRATMPMFGPASVTAAPWAKDVADRRLRSRMEADELGELTVTLTSTRSPGRTATEDGT